MSYTKRAIEKALYAPHELTPAERAFTRGIQPEGQEPAEYPDSSDYEYEAWVKAGKPVPPDPPDTPLADSGLPEVEF